VTRAAPSSRPGRIGTNSSDSWLKKSLAGRLDRASLVALRTHTSSRYPSAPLPRPPVQDDDRTARTATASPGSRVQQATVRRPNRSRRQILDPPAHRPLDRPPYPPLRRQTRDLRTGPGFCRANVDSAALRSPQRPQRRRTLSIAIALASAAGAWCNPSWLSRLPCAPPPALLDPPSRHIPTCPSRRPTHPS